MEDKKVNWGILDLVLIWLLGYVICPIIINTVLEVSGIIIIRESITDMLRALFCGYLTVFLIYLDLKIIRKQSFIKIMDLSWKHLFKYIMITPVFLICYIITSNFIRILLSPYLPDTVGSVYGASPDLLFTLYIPAVLMAPIVEEIYFRGFMQPYMVKKLGIVMGIVMTSLIFASAHIQYYANPISLISIFILALTLGMVRHCSKSMVPNTLLHLFNNLLSCFK